MILAFLLFAGMIRRIVKGNYFLWGDYETRIIKRYCLADDRPVDCDRVHFV